MNHNRERTLTQRVESKHGTHYVHVAFNQDGHASGVRISSPGKFKDSELGELLEAISDAVSELMA